MSRIALALGACAAGALALPCAAQPDTQQLQVLRRAIETRPAQVLIDRPITAKPPSSATPSAPSTPAAPVLKAGTLYKVQLPREEERQVDAVVMQRVRPSVDATVVPLAGVVRQLTQEGREVQLKPFVLAGQPLTWREKAGLFEGSLRVGVADIFDQAQGKRLSAPLTFQVLEGHMAQPDTVTLAATSPPYQTIVVRAASPERAVTVRVASPFDPQGSPVELPVQPTLLLRAERPEIQGYGLETTVVHITAFGLANPGGRLVQLAAAPSAYLEASQVRLEADGTARAVLRSDGTGLVTVSAASAGLAAFPATVRFVPPVRTLAAAVIGGLLGGLVRLLPQARRRRGSQLALGLAVAVLTGLLVFLLYAVGVNVLPVTLQVTVGTVAVLVVAALGAWFGTALLKNLNRG
jgi:hypothetical protein